MPAPSSSAEQPLHAFRPTSGTFVGFAALAAAALLTVVTLLSEPNLTGVRVALGTALVGLLVWMVLLRPRVRAYADTLVLRNMVSETHLPMAKVEDVVVRHTLNVWVDERRYTCSGIGRSSRAMLREQRRGAAPSSGDDYAAFVETTIDELARSARTDLRNEPPPVRRLWALPELVAGGVLAVALLGTALL